ncbi:arsenic efflux protein, partial [bacterium]|nr:arsenic efflux protein [bacterium]
MAEFFEILKAAAVDGFMSVGTWVAVMLLVFGWLEVRTAGGIVRGMRKYRKWQPIFGAVLGVIPGCGGAIFMMPLFVNGTVTFGTVVATLIATMGDSSWVIFSRLPGHALVIHGISFAVGIGAGYLVDALGIGKNLVKGRQREAMAVISEQVEKGKVCLLPGFEHTEPAGMEAALHKRTHIKPKSLFYRITHNFFLPVWILFLVGFVFTFLSQMLQIDTGTINGWFGFPLFETLGIIGAVVSLVWMVFAKKLLRDDTHEEDEEKAQSFREMLVHNAEDTAFVVVWVTAAYFVFYAFNAWSGVDLSSIVRTAGPLAVIGGAVIGLIPGCGPQIVVTTLFVQGIVPFGVLIANVLSQDGDALFPLLSLHKKSALMVTLVTTVPAVIVGLAFHYLLPGFLAAPVAV